MTVTRVRDLPLAGRDRKSDAAAADVVDGELKVVPRAVIAAAAVVDGARGGVNVPKGDIDRIKSHLAEYYAKMGATPPWER